MCHFRKAFSLIELLGSLAVLAILMSISFGAWTGVTVAEQRRQAEAAMSQIETELGVYYLERGTYPTSLTMLQASRLDPWGNVYHYERKAHHSYVLLSAGPDGLVGKPFDEDNVVRKN